MRWNHLKPVLASESAPYGVSRSHWLCLCAVADDVCTRTGARCWYDIRTAQITFGYRRPSGRVDLIGLPDIHAFRGVNRTDSPNVFDPAVDRFLGELPLSVDEVVRMIQLAKVDPAIKERWRRQQDDVRRHAADEAAGRAKERRIAHIEDVLRHTYNRSGMGSHFRGSAVVNGLRGG